MQPELSTLISESFSISASVFLTEWRITFFTWQKSWLPTVMRKDWTQGRHQKPWCWTRFEKQVPNLRPVTVLRKKCRGQTMSTHGIGLQGQSLKKRDYNPTKDGERHPGRRKALSPSKGDSLKLWLYHYQLLATILDEKSQHKSELEKPR